MKRIIRATLLCALVSIGACTASGPSGQAPSGTATPPFEGKVPEDAFISEAQPGKYGGTLVMAAASNPKSFNPVIGAETSTAHIINNVVYKALTDFDNNEQKDIPGLAKSWESTEDGLHWTFHLRKGVQWSDGQPFTADDVIFTVQVTFDPNVNASADSTLVQSDGTLPTVEKVDDYTVKFHLKEPNALFIATINSIFLIPRHKWEGAYKSGNFNQSILLNTDPKDIVGLGPYRVTSFTNEQRVVLERNPYYWKVDKNNQRLPYLDRVIFLIVPNFNTVVLKFQNAETDLVHSIPPDQFDLLKRDEQSGDYTVHNLGPSFNTTYLILNQDSAKFKNPVKLKWFRDQKFRQAVSYAIDREGIVRTVFLGHGVPNYSFDSPASKVWSTDQITKYPYNVERAKALLKEIGIEDRNGDGVAEDSEGHPIKFSIMTNSSNTARVNIATMVKENLSKVGMEIDLQPLDFNLVVTKTRSTRDFDGVVGSWQSGIPPDPINAKNALLPGATDYYAFPNQASLTTDWEKRIEELIGLCSRTNDLATRQKYYWEAMRIWSEYLPQIDLVVPGFFVAAKNKVGNLKPSALANYTYWNIEELYFTK